MTTVRALAREAPRRTEALTGHEPLGYHAGLPSLDTRDLVVEAGCFPYTSDIHNDDLPYGSPDHPGLLMALCSLVTDDSRLARDGGGYVPGTSS